MSHTYDAWGNVLSTTGSLSSTLGAHNPLRYRGYVYDTETELYYLQSRYYDPSLGRFLNADGYASTGQGILGNNMFAYCLNNPVVFKDSTGLLCSYIRPMKVTLIVGRGEPRLSDYIDYITPVHIKEMEKKIGRIINKTLDGAGEAILGDIDRTMFVGAIPAVFGKAAISVPAVLIDLGVGFLFGAAHGLYEAIQEEIVHGKGK